MFRFLHAADIHLDSPLRGLTRYPDAPLEELQGATRAALKNLVDQALRLEVDLLVLAGDIYDGDWPDYNTGLFFVQQMSRLDAAGIPVISVSGNHDAQSRITRNLRLPPNVTSLSVEKPQTVLLEEAKVAIHGQGFAQPVITDDLSKDYPAPVEGYFNLGILHTSADGRPGHDTYAPCSVEHLKRLGYQYWALGHIHQREILNENPWIVFCGNLQGRHAKETGPKGATLVSVENSQVTEVKPLILDVVRWTHLRIDITELEEPQDFWSAVEEQLVTELAEAGGRLLAFRVETVGSGPLHSHLSADLEHWNHELRNLSLQVGGRAWFEKLKLSSSVVRNPSDRATDHTLTRLLDMVQNRSPEELEEMSKDLFETLHKKLPRAWRTGSDAFDPFSREVLQSLVRDASGILEERLTSKGRDN